MKAIILAAGKGERLKPLTDNIPKPMVLINGRPSLEYIILLCKKHGVKEIAINTSYLPEKITEYFGSGEKWGVNLRFSFELDLLGTAGALNNFKDFFDEPFFVIYGDNITNIDLTKMREYHLKKKGLVTLALRKKPKDYKTQSIVLADDKLKVTKFIEKPSEEQVNQISEDYKLINSGIYILNPEILNYIPLGFSDFAYDIFPKIINQRKKIYGFIMDDYYFREIGKIDKYNLAKEEIEGGVDLGLLDKAVFLDRDGVINEVIYEVDGRLMAPANIEQVKLLPNVKEGILEFKKMGFKVIVISNQPGVAFGYVDLKKLNQIDEFLKKELELDGIYYCPHHEKINGPCECRKPKPALINRAVKDFDLDLKKSFMVGDSLSDIQTGKNVGVKSNFLIGIVREDILNLQHQKGIFPDFTCKNLLEVVEKIKEITG